VIALPLGGFLCVNGLDGGWPSIFYLFGLVGIIWFVIWMVCASDSPTKHKFIGENEQDYIVEQTKETIQAHAESESGAPWGAILTSKACIAVFFGHCNRN
jgi:MFS family permease